MEMTMEQKKDRRFAWLQFDASEAMKHELKMIQDEINWDHLGKDGLETQFHVTVLYGLHCFRPQEIISAFCDARPVTWKFGQISLFKNKGAHVLKMSVQSPQLVAFNETLSRRLPHFQNFSYSPHVTIAHLRPGQGSRYEGLSAPRLQETSNVCVLHGRGRERFEIRLDGAKNDWDVPLARPVLF